MERHFDEELKMLNTDLLKMAALTEEAIYRSIESLRNRDSGLAHDVIDQDHVIDELELVIEERAIYLLALRQPMAVDLRFITTAMKINSEIERIADLAVDICQRSLEIADKPHLKPLVDIPRLSEVSRRMVRAAIDSFVDKDEELAKKVIFSDSEADDLRNRIQDEIVKDFLSKDSSTAPRAIPLLLVARHLERICDHATYIAQDVIYMVRAEVVRHHLEKLKKEIGDDPRQN
jgi:phosphate transport system protein